MTVTSSLNIGGVSFTTSGLTITENVSARVFTMTGDAGLSAGKLANVQVEFGSPASNGNAGSTGLVITGGTLTSLDMTVSSTITEAGVTLTADGLHLIYSPDAQPGHVRIERNDHRLVPRSGELQRDPGYRGDRPPRVC